MTSYRQGDSAITIPIPDWVGLAVAAWSCPIQGDAERMACAVELARINVENGGGPFAALVFAGDVLLGAGVNRVLDTGYSIAHAEVLAITLAQRNKRDLLVDVGRPLTLISTTEPCCQCFGALIWAGIEHLVCGATTSDAQDVGFDEGPKPANWEELLRQRGVSVVREVHRRAAIAVLSQYVHQGGEIYGRAGSPKSGT